MKKQHIILLLPLLCLFFVCSKAQDDPELPSLPENFWTTIEVNIVNKNYTTRRNEFYDYQNDRVRFDVYTQDSDYVEIYEVDKNLHYEIVNFQTCQVRTIDGNMSRLIDSDHHLMNTSSLFRFGASYNETYDGVFSARGILCRRWSSFINDTREDGTWSAYTLYYYFSEPSWEIDEGNHPEFEVPIRAEIDGITSYTNGTSSPFHHIYEFVFFQIGIPPSFYFDFFEQFRCGSVMDHPLPELPNQFSTIVEMNVVNKNYTSIIKEYYDYENDRSRYEFYRRGHSYVEIILPESGYSYQVTDGTKCVIRTLNSSSPFGDQTAHLRSVSQLFHFGSQYNETYEGIREVRGISCDYWLSDIVEHDNRTGTTMNYTLGWYFSVDSWDSRSKGQHNHRIPIRAEINGISTMSNGTSHSFYHVYEFIDFVPGAPEEELFEHPGDVICRGPVGVDLPELADTYSTTIEFTDLINNLTGVLTEYYDYESDRARYDYFYEDSSHIFLMLPEKNLTYAISHGTYHDANDTTCEIHTASLSTLLPASDLWEFSSNYNETYQGTTTVRGIPCDFWSHKVNRVDEGNRTLHLDVLYYFSIDSWEMRGAHTEHRVPVQFKATGNMTEGNTVTQLNLVYSFVNFEPNYIPDGIFDLKPEWNCGAHEYLTYVGFLLDVPLKDFNAYVFVSGLESMLNVTEEHVYVISASGNTTVWVEFTAGNQTELDRINKAIKDMEIVDSPYTITSYSQTSSLECEDGCGNGYCHFGTCICSDDYAGATCDKKVDNSQSGLSAGGVVGILILGLFVGAAVGAFIVYVYLRRKIKDKMSRNMVALDERDDQGQVQLE